MSLITLAQLEAAARKGLSSDAEIAAAAAAAIEKLEAVVNGIETLSASYDEATETLTLTAGA